jgi:hypothetical protein
MCAPTPEFIDAIQRQPITASGNFDALITQDDDPCTFQRSYDNLFDPSQARIPRTIHCIVMISQYSKDPMWRVQLLQDVGQIVYVVRLAMDIITREHNDVGSKLLDGRDNMA